MNSHEIHLLTSAIDAAIGQPVNTSRRFERLAAHVFQRTHRMIGVTTLKRLWGYINDPTEPRTSTLDILAQFIGYTTFDDFTRCTTSSVTQISSNLTFGECYYVDDMAEGDSFRLSWAPNRVCDIEYRGDYTFVVTASRETRLTPGATFCCRAIEVGQPLYIDHLFLHPDQSIPFNYIAGKIGGVNIEEAKCSAT